MIRYSIPDIPATYSVSPELISSSPMLTMWAGWCENLLIGYYATRVEAECRCKWHYSESLCYEEA